jgi:hypothetical protein
MNEVNRDVIESVLQKMSANYADWSVAAQRIAKYEHNKDKVWVHWYDEYKVNTEFNIGRTYVKLIHAGSAVGFIVISKKDKKFAYGDILKVASWKAPARNFARGNVFTDMPEVIQWTGV